MRLGDLRDWLEEVEALGELRLLRGAHWRLQIGAATELNNRRSSPPALLFDEIPDYAKGYRVVTSSNVAPSRLGLSLRLGTNHTTESLIGALRGRPHLWESRAAAYPPRIVATGPVLEEVHEGSDVNLWEFPAPLWHEGDGGRYLGTACLVITRDPEAGWINVGSYRLMVHDERSLGLFVLTGKHGRLHYEEAFRRGESFPVAVSLGHDPLLALLAGLEIPYGVSEFNYAGAIAGEPLEVIRSDMTGLPFPARSEIVVEGWLRPGLSREEGPFGEFHGYYSTSEIPCPVIQVERVRHRRDPILLGSPPGRPPHDYSYWVSILRSALIWDALEAAGVPEVRGMWQHPLGGARMLTVVSIHQRYAGHARQAAYVAAQCRAGAQMGRYTIVVDEDIDPKNLEEVMWAVVTRSDPERDIEILRRTWGSQVDPLFSAYSYDAPFNSRAIIDATIPWERRDRFPKVIQTDPALLEEIRRRWPEV